MAADQQLPAQSVARRAIAHLVFVALLMAAGAYVFSYHAFSLFFPRQDPPIALLIGMALPLALVAIPMLAGFGSRLLIDVFVRQRPLTPKDLFDLLATTQYFTIAIVLCALHYIAR
jgi:hypothetical protein